MMEREGFAKREGIRLEIVPARAPGDATNVAIQGEAVDIIVNDWIWVADSAPKGATSPSSRIRWRWAG